MQADQEGTGEMANMRRRAASKLLRIATVCLLAIGVLPFLANPTNAAPVAPADYALCGASKSRA